MKTIKHFVPLSLLAAGLFAFASCSEDDNENSSKNPDFKGTTEVSASDIVTTDSCEIDVCEMLEAQIKALESENSEANEEELKELHAELNKTDSINKAMLDSLKQQANDIGEESPSGVNLKVFIRKIQYKSKSADGSDITLSAVVGFSGWSVGYFFGVAHFYDEPDDLILGCHATIASNSECPSERIQKGKTSLYADQSELLCSDVGMMLWDGRSSSMQTLTVIPDYEGYGDTQDRAHPYLMQKATARQVVDAGLQAIKWFKNYTKEDMEDDWNTVIIGYSQGAAVAMATQKYIEENNLGSAFHLSGAVCGSGPYSPLVTLKQYIKDNKLYLPSALALIVKGTIDYDTRMKDYTPSDYFTDEFVKTGIFRAIDMKDRSTSGLENMLKDGGVKPNKDNYWTVDQCLRQEVIDYMNGEKVDEKYEAKLKALYDAMYDNDLIASGWQPSHRIILFHGAEDEVVPIANYWLAAHSWLENDKFCGIRFNKWDIKSHGDVGSEFYKYWDTKLMRRVLGDDDFKSGTEFNDGERSVFDNITDAIIGWFN